MIRATGNEKYDHHLQEMTKHYMDHHWGQSKIQPATLDDKMALQISSRDDKVICGSVDRNQEVIQMDWSLEISMSRLSKHCMNQVTCTGKALFL